MSNGLWGNTGCWKQYVSSVPLLLPEKHLNRYSRKIKVLAQLILKNSL